jgi:hypothetical protein
VDQNENAIGDFTVGAPRNENCAGCGAGAAIGARAAVCAIVRGAGVDPAMVWNFRQASFCSLFAAM